MMELNHALERIKYVSHIFAEQEIHCIRENRAAAIPILLEYIKAPVEHGSDLPENYDAHFYAMFLLAEFRVQEAFPYLIKYLEFEEAHSERLLGDVVTEGLGSILASVATSGDVPRIKAVIENTELDTYRRSAAANALLVLYSEGIYERDAYFSYLQYLLENVHDDPTFTAFLIADCEETGNHAFMPVIERLFKAQLVDEDVTDLEFVHNALLATDEESAKQAMRCNEDRLMIRDVVMQLGRWACFTEKPHFGRKVGRNEPCPCGSGKKYKKCCGY